MRTIWVYKGTPNPPVKPSVVLNRGIVFNLRGWVATAVEPTEPIPSKWLSSLSPSPTMRGRALRPFIVLLIAIVVASIVFVPPTSGTLRVAARPAPIRVTASTPEAIGPFEPNIKITDGSSPFGWQVEPTMVVNESGTAFVGWKETNGPEAAGYRVGSSYSTDQGRTWANNILMNQTHPNQNCRDSDPWMALDPRDRVHFAYLEYDPSGGSLPPCGSGLDVSNTSDGQDWGTVHYIPGLGGLVDKDSIAFDSAGRLYAAWDEGNILALSWSDDDGNHWAPSGIRETSVISYSAPSSPRSKTAACI